MKERSWTYQPQLNLLSDMIDRTIFSIFTTYKKFQNTVGTAQFSLFCKLRDELAHSAPHCLISIGSHGMRLWNRGRLLNCWGNLGWLCWGKASLSAVGVNPKSEKGRGMRHDGAVLSAAAASSAKSPVHPTLVHVNQENNVVAEHTNAVTVQEGADEKKLCK